MTDAVNAAILAAFGGPTEWGSGRWAEYRRCEYAYKLRWADGLTLAPQQRDDDELELDDDEPADNGRVSALDVGSLVHAGLAWEGMRWCGGTGGPWAELFERLIAGVEGLPAFDPRAITEAARLLAGYFAEYGEANAGWPEDYEIIAVEQLLGAEPATCRPDLVLRHRDSGMIMIPDHKTRAQAFPKDRGRYARGLRTRSQFCQISAIARQHFKLDYPPVVIVNAIIKTKIPKYDRIVVRFTDEDLHRWQLAQNVIVHRHPRTVDALPYTTLQNFDACAPEIGRPCWAFHWCHGTDEQRERLYTLRKKEAA